MRVVVAAPQVPFVRGGAELMAEDLVDGPARARARRGDRQHPVQVVPGLARARPGVPLAPRRPDRVRRPADRPRDRDEVPRVLRPPPEQGRVGAAPVPAGVRLRPHRARPVRRVAGRPRDAPRDRASRCRRARRGAQSVRDLAQRRRSPPALQRRSRRRCCRTRRSRSPTARRSRRATSSRSTGSTARSGSTCSLPPRSATRHFAS